MQESYTTVAGPACDEFVEKRSRFIGEIRPVTTAEEAAAFLAEKRAKHWDATHNCSAYILRSGSERYSDDGEPQGTAGVPMLEVLRREKVEDVMVVVTRYFGGTLLGAGGLVRAYTHGAKIALDAAQRVEVCRCNQFFLTVPYPLYDRIAVLLREWRAVVLDTDFTEAVTLHVRQRYRDYESFLPRLTELTGGSVAPFGRKEEFSSMPEN